MAATRWKCGGVVMMVRHLYKGGNRLQEEIQQTQPPPEGVAIWFLGQAGVVIKGPADTGLLCVDPYLTNAIEEETPGTEFVRTFPPPMQPDQLAGAVAALATHFHNDHLDLATLRPLAQASSGTTIVVPAPSVGSTLNAGIPEEQLRAARAGQPLYLGAFQVEPIAVPHVTYETDEQGDHLFLGYGIQIGGVRFFHSGDCVADSALLGLVRDLNPHVVILPINGEDAARTARGIVGNMGYRDAADFGVAVGADLIIPVHHDLFPNNSENPAYFVDYLFHQYPSQKFHMMVAGERLLYAP